MNDYIQPQPPTLDSTLEVKATLSRKNVTQTLLLWKLPPSWPPSRLPWEAGLHSHMVRRPRRALCISAHPTKAAVAASIVDNSTACLFMLFSLTRKFNTSSLTFLADAGQRLTKVECGSCRSWSWSTGCSEAERGSFGHSDAFRAKLGTKRSEDIKGREVWHVFPLFSTYFSQMGENKFNQKTPMFLSNYAIVTSKIRTSNSRQESTRSLKSQGTSCPEDKELSPSKSTFKIKLLLLSRHNMELC